MPFDKQILNNEVDIVSKLGLGGNFDFGLLTTAGADRLFQAIGAVPNIYINFVPKGLATLRVPTGYEALITDPRDIINKGYADIKMLGQDIMPPLQTPGEAEDGFAIVWDNDEEKFTLSSIDSNKTYGSGVEDVSNVVKWGGPALDRHTDISGVGTFNVNLGTLVSKLLNFEVNTEQKIELTAGTAKLILNGSNSVSLIGGASLSSIIINAGGGILIADNQGGTSQRGLRGGHDYSSKILDNDYAQKIYIDNRIATKGITNIVKNPTSAQNGFAIVWNNALGQYTLADTAGASVSTIPKVQKFVATDGQTAFVVDNGTILYINFVEINGDVQTEGEDYLRSGQIVNITPGLPAGYEVTVRYWEDLSVGGAGGGTVSNAHFLFSTDITETDPGDARVKINAVSLDAATEIYIDNSTTEGVDFSPGLEDLATGDSIRLQLSANDDDNAIFRLLAMPVNNAGWWTLSVANVSSTVVTFSDLAEMVVMLLYGGAGGGADAPNIDGGVADSIYNTLPIMDGGAP